ncbi:MAG: hypothetical protein Kow0031_10640 [Anaerolineae bacterium]
MSYYQKLMQSLPALMLMLTLLAGCGAASSEAPAMSQAVAEDAYYEAEMAAEAMPPSEPSGGYADGESMPLEDFLASAAQAQEMRVIIYTGDISLVVRDTEESVAAITQLAEEQGGYVSGANVYQSGEVLRGSMSIRVPAERYTAVIEQLRGMALRVERETASTQDVTEEYTDLQARKVNLEHTEAALQQLLDERQRVGSTSDILEVHRELTNIRGQIEQIEGRMRYLANQAALSTINISLTPDVLYQPISVAGWEPTGVAKEALQALVSALQGLTNITIWLVIFALPLLIIFLIPLVLVILVIRWWWNKRQSRPKPAQKKSEKPAAEKKEDV